MKSAWKIIPGVSGLAFVLAGLSWWVAPDFASAQLGMEVLSDVALSTQIGDLGSFFLTLGACVLIGLVTGNRLWIAPALMLLVFAVIGRLVAWGVYGAALPVHMIAVETVSGLILLFTARSLASAHR